MTAYVIIEWRDDRIHTASLRAITAACQLSANVQAVILGHHCQAVAAQVATIAGITRVLVADHALYQHSLAENESCWLVTHLTDCQYLLAAATAYGKNVLARTAGYWKTTQISHVTEVVDPYTFKHPMYAGNVIETVRVSGCSRLCLSIATTSFAPAAFHTQTASHIIAIEAAASDSRVEWLKHEKPASERPRLSDADIIIAGGRGLGSAENFERMLNIAYRLGAAVGASRAAVDAGFAPNHWQIGQTGQIVAPRLYFALGISGAAQHLAGIKESGKIIAINQDPNAPIFQIADYGLVADLNEVLTQWEQQTELSS